MAAIRGEKGDHFVDAKLGLTEHLAFHVEQKLPVSEIERSQAAQRAFQRHRLEAPREVRFPCE